MFFHYLNAVSILLFLKQIVSVMVEIPELKFDRLVSSCLEQYRNKNTQYKNRTAISCFFSFIEKRKIKTLSELDKSASQYLENRTNNIVIDLNHFVDHLSFLNYKEAYVHSTLQKVIQFFRFCHITFERSFVSNIMNRFFGKPIENLNISGEFLKNVYKHLPVGTSSMFLLSAESGLDLNEVLRIQTNDITWKRGASTIFVRDSIAWKNGRERTVFLTEEASKALKFYLCNRPENNPIVFPFDRRAVELDFAVAVRKARPNRTCNVSWEITKMWFLKRFSLYGSTEVGEKLAGMKPRNNLPFTNEELRTNFRKVAPYLQLIKTKSKKNTDSKIKKSEKKR